MKLKRIIFLCSLVMCFLSVFAAGKHKYTLVIDAGHGGKDAGACANRAMEKNINLSVALAFGRYVEQNCPDVRVIYTRKTDVFIPLHERASIANRNKADVFISIHTNALPGKSPRPVTGMETYTMGIRRSDEKLSAAKRENEVVLIEKDYQQHYAGYDPRSPESMMIFEIMNETNMAESVELARMIQQNTSRTAGRPNKGVRQDAFLVLRETSMPACLVELGYITTPSEAAYLTNKTNVDLMGRGIYQAFVAFKNKQTGKTVSAPVYSKEKETVEKTTETPRNTEVQKPIEVQKTTENQKTIDTQKSIEPQKPIETQKPVVVVEQTAKETASEIPQDTVPSPMPVQVQEQPTSLPASVTSAPIFKVQLFASSARIKSGDARMKGIAGVDSYQENGLWKYTVGASEDYNEIYRLRKQVLDKFPQAFIIAFVNGNKVDAAKAYQEFKKNRNKK